MLLQIISLFTTATIAIAAPDGTPSGWFDPKPEAGQPKTWKYGEDVVIQGENLNGEHDTEHGYPPEKEVCFISMVNDSDRKCYDSEHENIKTWTSNTIILKLDPDLYQMGTVKLRYRQYENDCTLLQNKRRGGVNVCDDTLKWNDELAIGNYMLYPTITGIYNKATGEHANGIKIGEKHEIRGYWLGHTEGQIFIGGTQVFQTDINLWTPTFAEFTPSNIGGSKIRVQTGISKSEEFDVEKVYQEQSNKNTEEDQASSSSSISSTEEDPENIFADVKSTHPYNAAIRWGKETAVVDGYPDGTFKPDRGINRAEFLKIILESDSTVSVALATEPTGFSDVNEGEWYAPYIRYAKDNGIIEGYPDGTFRPGQAVNFAEALKMAYSALGVPTVLTEGEWYERFLMHAKDNNILFSNSIDVGSDMTRKDVVWIVWNLTNTQ